MGDKPKIYAANDENSPKKYFFYLYVQEIPRTTDQALIM